MCYTRTRCMYLLINFAQALIVSRYVFDHSSNPTTHLLSTASFIASRVSHWYFITSRLTIFYRIVLRPLFDVLLSTECILYIVYFFLCLVRDYFCPICSYLKWDLTCYISCEFCTEYVVSLISHDRSVLCYVVVPTVFPISITSWILESRMAKSWWVVIWNRYFTF